MTTGDPTPVDETEADASPTVRKKRVVWGAVGVVVVIGAIITAIVVGGSLTSDRGTIASPSAVPSVSPSASADSESTPSASPSDGAAPDPSEPTTDPVVPIDAPATVAPGIDAQILRLEAVDGTAQSPGEVAGPAIRFAVNISNNSAEAISLSTVTVTLDYGTDRTPGSELAQPGGAPLVGQVAPGATAEGVYIFTVPADARDLIRITVDYSADVTPLVFEGAGPV